METDIQKAKNNGNEAIREFDVLRPKWFDDGKIVIVSFDIVSLDFIISEGARSADCWRGELKRDCEFLESDNKLCTHIHTDGDKAASLEKLKSALVFLIDARSEYVPQSDS